MKRKNNTDLTLITIVVERKGCEFMVWCCFTCCPVLFLLLLLYLYIPPL